MEALLWLYCVLCLVCYRCAALQVQRQSLSSSSLIGNLPPVDSYIDVPWLASMPGNCQGIVLTPWLILSTANCLKKSKLSHLDISGVNDPESIPHGQKICLHPKFDPQDENDPLKADIGLVILEEPLYGDEIPISQSPNISLKSCSKCQYRSCEVYEYQSSKKLGTTRVKKIAVQLLDFSTCHHQHSYLEKIEGLCIQSQPREDCWIQRASPVLCLLKNHWELVGLTHKTSRICQNPTVIIRTAPYFSWMKRFIKASKKLLNPTSSLHCRTLQENEHVPQIRHGHNYIPTLASPNISLRSFQENSGISPQTKRVKDLTLFNFSNVNSITNVHKLSLDKSQTSKAVRLPAEQMKSLPGARLPENSGQNLIHQVTLSHNAGNLYKYPLSQLVSEPVMSYPSPKADGAKPWGFQSDNPDQSFDKIMADIIKQWSPSVDDETEPVHSHEASTTDDSLSGNASHFDEYANILKAMQNQSQHQHTTQTNIGPNFSLAEKEIPWVFFTSSGAVNKTGLPIDSLLANKTLDLSIFESRRIPKPSGTVEPGSSPSKSKANVQDQLVIDSVRSQNHPVSDADKFQIVPMVNLGTPSTSKVATYASLSNDLEAKTPPYQIPYSTLPSQGQSSFKDLIQPTVETQPLLKTESEKAGHQEHY
ncbi:uncharacterized protein LOC101844263 [Mesocricetus auratus]|uniref:Uncharacterized protein LOC101844263 n=1 Tax=Mesocricetus auratus TaxID=10036 RepID=A0A1U7R5C3_MESAU|nr:uncharacterized protein LOC101844263 [Mesocricetus auratus]